MSRDFCKSKVSKIARSATLVLFSHSAAFQILVLILAGCLALYFLSRRLHFPMSHFT
jgi:hypothetical protein